MLGARLISGTLLAALAGGVLLVDDHLARVFPCLLVCALLFALLATRELLSLRPLEHRPPLWLALAGIAGIVASNWVGPATWPPVLFALGIAFVCGLLWEVFTFKGQGNATARLSTLAFALLYLGVLPSFLIQLRWHPVQPTLALALVIFVPKVGDIGAYFTGRALGRHKMTPLLSPKKTWEGFAGGTLASLGTAVAATWHEPIFGNRIWCAVGFGLTVGLAGVLGDLAESLLKRDSGQKDAAKSIPGFGGVLDVIDSVLLAAPVGWVWLNSIQ